MKKFWLFGIVGFWLTVTVLPAAAQLQLAISPLRGDYKVAAGGSETNVIEVKNSGAQPLRLKVYAQDWTLDRKGNITYARAGTSPNSCATWLQMNPTDFRLDPGTRLVRYTLTVPPGAKPGSYWAVILFEGLSIQDKPIIGRRVGVAGRLGAVIYETVGNPPIKPEIQNLTVDAGTSEPVFRLTLANKGTGYCRLQKSSLILKNSQGKEVARLEVPDIPLLPGKTREVEIKATKALPQGEYLAEAVLDAGKLNLLGRKLNFKVGGNKSARQ